jgi:hypothetical protein
MHDEYLVTLLMNFGRRTKIKGLETGSFFRLTFVSSITLAIPSDGVLLFLFSITYSLFLFPLSTDYSLGINLSSWMFVASTKIAISSLAGQQAFLWWPHDRTESRFIRALRLNF